MPYWTGQPLRSYPNPNPNPDPDPNPNPNSNPYPNPEPDPLQTDPSQPTRYTYRDISCNLNLASTHSAQPCLLLTVTCLQTD